MIRAESTLRLRHNSLGMFSWAKMCVTILLTSQNIWARRVQRVVKPADQSSENVDTESQGICVTKKDFNICKMSLQIYMSGENMLCAYITSIVLQQYWIFTYIICENTVLEVPQCILINDGVPERTRIICTVSLLSL